MHNIEVYLRCILTAYLDTFQMYNDDMHLKCILRAYVNTFQMCFKRKCVLANHCLNNSDTLQFNMGRAALYRTLAEKKVAAKR